MSSHPGVAEPTEKPLELSFEQALTLGHELIVSNNFDEAEAVLRKVVASRPNDESGLHTLAVALIEQETKDKCREASELLTRAGALVRDELVAITCNMGKALGEQGLTEEAINAFDSVLRSYPEHTNARYGRALMLMQHGAFGQSIGDFDTVLRADPDNGKALFARGFANLVLGNYAEGFRDYEFRRKDLLAPIEKPTWTGGDLTGKTILVHGEQGHGDDIMFLRYVPQLVERGAKVLLALVPSIGALVPSMPGVTNVGEDRATWPHFDCWIRMMSLAAAFGTTMPTVPPPLPLKLDHDEIEEFWGTKGSTPEQRQYTEMYGRNSSARVMRKPKIGLCWSGSPKSRYDGYRSIPLTAMAPLFDTNAAFYSLQLGLRDSDKDAFARYPIIDLSPRLKSFRDTALAMAGLDLVITCDTSVAHLAGTVGVPTCVLINAFRTYWVWIQGLHWSPWYPSVTVIQQTQEGDWSDAIRQVCERVTAAAQAA